MTELINAILPLIDKYGLPLVMLLIFAYVMLRRKLVTRGEYDQKVADDAKDLTYVDERRKEEREGRLLAEARLDRTLDTTKDLAGLLKDIERELSRLGLVTPPGVQR